MDTQNLSKVEKVLFNSAMRFYSQLGYSEQEASYRAWKDMKAKFDIPQEEWVDITTGRRVEGQF